MWFASPRALIARGLVTIAFGMLLMWRPGISLQLFILVFAAYALLEGAFVLTAAAVAPRGEPGRAVAFVAGGLGLTIGVFTFLWPGLTELALLILIALRVLVVGVAEIATAVYIGRHQSGWGTAMWLLACVGLLSIAFSTILLMYPSTGLLALVWAIGFYAVLLGMVLITKAWLLAFSSLALHSGT